MLGKWRLVEVIFPHEIGDLRAQVVVDDITQKRIGVGDALHRSDADELLAAGLDEVQSLGRVIKKLRYRNLPALNARLGDILTQRVVTAVLVQDYSLAIQG